VLSITSHKVDADRTHKETSHLSENWNFQKDKKITKSSDDVEKGHLYNVGGNIN
jgi:hypothetical protein